MNGKMKHFSNITKRYFANDDITETRVYNFKKDNKDAAHINIEYLLTKDFAELNTQGNLIPGIVIGIMFLLKYSDTAHQIYEDREIPYESKLLKKFDLGLNKFAGVLTTETGISKVLKQTFNNLGFNGISCVVKKINGTVFKIDLSNSSDLSMSLFLKFGNTDIKTSTVTVTTQGCSFVDFFPVKDIADGLFLESMDWIKATLAKMNTPENSSVVAQNG